MCDQSGTADLLAGGWTIAAVINMQSGFPIGLTQSDNTLLAGANRPNLTGVGLETSGSFADRLASADHPTATWINPAAFTPAPAGTFGNAPRSITEVRTPPISQHRPVGRQERAGLGGGKSAQIKLESDQPVQPGADQHAIGATAGSSTFGQITTQSGFMRIMQFMFRFSF